MSTGEHEVTRDELHAYADRELTPERASVVETWLEEDPDARALVRDARRIDSELQSVFGPVAAEPVPPRLLSVLDRRGARRRLWWRAAAAALILLVGGIAGWFGRDIATRHLGAVQTLANESISAHRVFTVEIKHPVEVGAAQEQHLVRWLTKRLGAPLKAPNLRELGYDLVGGRLLSADAGPAAQFMYESADGRRITIYVRRNVSGQETAFRFQAAGDLSGFYWLEPQLAYAIIAELPRERLLSVAEVIYDQLEEDH